MMMSYSEIAALVGACLFIGALIPFTLLLVAVVAIWKDVR